MTDAQGNAEIAADLCVVGSGITGMNALAVAGMLLPPGSRLVVIDRHDRVGGMWVTAYPYVRLHQPHGQFTAGNIDWTLGAPREHLATRSEVLDHFTHCLDTVRRRHDVETLFGWEHIGEDETADAVVVTARHPDGGTTTIRDTRLVKAYGAGITPNEPLALSSAAVRSVSPDQCDMRTGDIASDQAPVWVIGGGKTAMDTAHELVTAYPGRDVRLVVGGGTTFLNRTALLPPGRARWRCTTVTQLFIELAHRFDGDNDGAVHEWLCQNYGLALVPEPKNHLLGFLSESENETIRAGVREVVVDHVVDVVDVDSDGRPELVLRSGERRPVEPGSWVVNCTGYFDKDPDRPPETKISPGGRVMTVGLRSALFHLGAYDAYFSTYALLSGKLPGLPLFEADWSALRVKDKRASIYALPGLTMYNLAVLADALPQRAFTQFALNSDRYYPVPRQLVASASFMRDVRKNRDHYLRSLERVFERYDVRAGLMPV